jgi:hypothetical protein
MWVKAGLGIRMMRRGQDRSTAHVKGQGYSVR